MNLLWFNFEDFYLIEIKNKYLEMIKPKFKFLCKINFSNFILKKIFKAL